MADMTDEQRRYNSNVNDLEGLANQESSDINKTAQKIPAHEGENKTTRSTEGSATKTTTEKKA